MTTCRSENSEQVAQMSLCLSGKLSLDLRVSIPVGPYCRLSSHFLYWRRYSLFGFWQAGCICTTWQLKNCIVRNLTLMNYLYVEIYQAQRITIIILRARTCALFMNYHTSSYQLSTCTWYSTCRKYPGNLPGMSWYWWMKVIKTTNLRHENAILLFSFTVLS